MRRLSRKRNRNYRRKQGHLRSQRTLATVSFARIFSLYKGVSVVIIENKSKFTLEYVNSGYTTGWPVADVKNAFKLAEDDDDIYTIPPGAVATLFYRVHQGGHYGKMVGNLFSFGIAQTKHHSQVARVQYIQPNAVIVKNTKL